MATTLFFEGRVTGVPGSYSKVDDTGLEQVGLGASGIVAVVGEAEGGKPVSQIEELKDFIRFTRPGKVGETFKSGPLLEAAPILFAPASDADILGGAQEMVAMKVNPALQSEATFSNAQGDAMKLTSRDYGAFTAQINVSIQDGETQGKLVTIIFEDSTETVNDLGGDDLFNLSYEASTNSWNTMTGQVIAGGLVEAKGTRDVGGLDSDVLTGLAAPGAIQVVSDNAADVGMIATVYGLEETTGNVIKEVFTLDGTNPQVGTKTFAAGDVLGVKILGTTAGNVSVEPSGGGADVFTVAAGTNPVAGLKLGETMYASSVVTLVSDGASVKDVILVGLSASGSEILEKVTLTGTTPVDSVGVFAQITSIVLGDVEAAQTLTVSATAAKTTTGLNTLQKIDDFFNAKYIEGVGGFVFTMVTSATQSSPTRLDVMVAAVDIKDPANPGFKADLWAIIDWINQNSTLVSAEAIAGAVGGAPSNTATPIYLVGGTEGTTAFADWQKALNLLKKARVNSIVVLTPDPAVHAALDAHCAYMGGVGRSERDGFVGLMNTAMDGLASKTEVKEQIVDLNTRHIRSWAQGYERFNTLGERTEYAPMYGAVALAGMQAGSPVGTSLTFKYLNTLGLTQHSTWNPTDDAEEMIQAGLVFGETIEGVGTRVVRNITTWLKDNNIARTEGSVNEAVNFASFNFRTNMEWAVGRRGFSGTINGAKGIAIGTLGLLVDEQTLVAWRALDFELIVDVLDVSLEIAPVIPINFVKNTLHLVTIRQTAA